MSEGFIAGGENSPLSAAVQAEDALRNSIQRSMLFYALGDAWGYLTEFYAYREILKASPMPPPQLKISDDTQMSIYAVQAVENLRNSDVELSDVKHDESVQNAVGREFGRQFLDFYEDPRNDRAPGVTCMDALRKYRRSVQETGSEGNDNDSLGCGTVMRSPWLGYFDEDREVLAVLNIVHAQVTHGDPKGWLVSAVSALVIHDLLYGEGASVGEGASDASAVLFRVALRVVREMRSFTSPVVQALSSSLDAVEADLQSFVERWDHICELLSAGEEAPFSLSEDSMVYAFFSDPAYDGDVVDASSVFGEGWIADEALYAALGVVSFYMESMPEYRGDAMVACDMVMRAVRRLVYTKGDSDSIAAIGGALVGAVADAVPVGRTLDVLNSLEQSYSHELSRLLSITF